MAAKKRAKGSKGQRSKAPLAIAAVAVVVVVVALVVGLRSCSSSGSAGEGGEAPATPATQTQTAPDSSPAPDTGAGTGGSDALTPEQLREELSTNTAPVGENERSVQDSAAVPTTAEVYAAADDRGFQDAPVMANFNMDGTSVDSTTLDAQSTQKHPSYMLAYVSPSDVTWFVYVNDGAYLAVPMAMGTEPPTQEIILTETDHVVQYDALANEYSDFPLDQLEGAVGVRVDRIDAATLDAYTPEELEGLG